jgi:hypothetical protein
MMFLFSGVEPSPRQSFGRNETHPTAKRVIAFCCRYSGVLTFELLRSLPLIYGRRTLEGAKGSERMAQCVTDFI